MVATEKILAEIRRKPASCYVLAGGEEFLKEEFIREIRSILPAPLASLNFDAFTAGDVPAPEIVSAALSYPFGADLRVVLVKECGRFKPGEQEVLLAYIKNPSEQTVLLLDFEKPPSSRAFLKKLASSGREISFSAKKRSETEAWLRKRAAGSGKKLSSAAAAALGGAGGDHLRLLANEIDRLCLQAGEREEITAGDAASSAEVPRSRTGFEVAEAVSRGDSAAALRHLSEITKGAPAPELITGTLAWHFRSVWKVRAALAGGMPRNRIAASCGVPPFRVGEFIRAGGRHSEESLASIFMELLAADVRMKTRQSTGLEMELLVVRLCLLSGF